MTDSNTIAGWRKYSQRYLLEGNHCTACGVVYLPKEHCCVCGCRELKKICLMGKGTLQSFTQIINPPYEYKKMAPYCVGLVTLDEGPTIVVQLTDVIFEKLYIGMRMRSVFRKYIAQDHGVIYYGLKFSPEEA